jgi:hypothetical protein
MKSFIALIRYKHYFAVHILFDFFHNIELFIRLMGHLQMSNLSMNEILGI